MACALIAPLRAPPRGRPSRRVRVGGPRRGRSDPRARRRTAPRMSASVSPSRPAVGSSSRSRGASRRKARASATRWRSPAESPAPRSPSTVPAPSGTPSDHVAETSLLDRLPQRGVVGVLPPEPDVVRDRLGEEVWPLGHPGHVGAPRVRVEVAEVDAPDANRPSLRRDEAQHHREQGGLPAAARPGDGDDLARLDGERRPRRGRAWAGRRRSRSGRTPPAGGCAGSGTSVRVPRDGTRLVEHAEHLLGGADAVGAGVEGRADVA